MNRLFYTALTALALAGCSPKSEICGTYNGLLPAADGPGIDMTLQLNANNTFVNKLVYVGQKDGTFYEKGTYEVMYVFRSKIYEESEIVFKYYQFTDAVSETEFEYNMMQVEDMSLYDTGVSAEYGDELLTLSTCDYYTSDGRFVVVAKKIR